MTQERARLVGFLVLAVAIIASGCSGTNARRRSGHCLPFVVKLHRITLPDPGESDIALITPVKFEQDVETLTGEFGEALRNAGTFTDVVIDDESPGGDFDLELSVTFEGWDFGEGTPLIGGALLSTFSWLMAGHASWFVDDRRYPDSAVSAVVTVLTAESQGVGEGFRVNIPISDLRLSLVERVDAATSVQNIFLPPWAAAGSREARGSSLARRAMEALAATGPEQLEFDLPGRLLEQLSAFLVHDSERRRLTVACDRELRRLDLQVAGSALRRLGQEEIDLVRVSEESLRADVETELRRHDAPVSADERLYYYRFHLEDGEDGQIRVVATFDRGKSDPGKRRWTINQLPAVSSKDPPPRVVAQAP